MLISSPTEEKLSFILALVSISITKRNTPITILAFHHSTLLPLDVSRGPETVAFACLMILRITRVDKEEAMIERGRENMIMDMVLTTVEGDVFPRKATMNLSCTSVLGCVGDASMWTLSIGAQEGVTAVSL